MAGQERMYCSFIMKRGLDKQKKDCQLTILFCFNTLELLKHIAHSNFQYSVQFAIYKNCVIGNDDII